MSKATLWLAGAALALCAAPASAQDFLFESAPTIGQGAFKVGVYPAIIFGKNGSDNNSGVATRLGYGFTSRFDLQARLNFFDGLQMYGGDARYWVVTGGRPDVSVSAGFHKSSFDSGVDSKAFDVAFDASTRVARSLDAYGALSVSFESLDNVPDSGFTRVYIVPGIDYTLSRNVHLLAELGLGLNGDSPNYFGGGLSVYLR